MAKISFWRDEVKKTVDPMLFSKRAEELSTLLAEECRQNRGINKRTQIRRFYDEVARLDMAARRPESEWDSVLPLLHMLVAKAAYARGRNLVSEEFVHFIKSSIEQVKQPKDLIVFAGFFEAFMGFYRRDCPVN